MSNESEIQAINQKITVIQDTNSQILKELTELSTSFRYMKEKIDSHALDMVSIQDRTRANEIDINGIKQTLERMDKNTDRWVNPVIRHSVTVLITGVIMVAVFMIKIGGK